DAAADFKKLKEEYPYSKYATLAALKLGDAYFGDEKYSLAAMSYSDFARLHPGNKNTPYVLYQAGMSHFLMFTAVDRTQDETAAAMKIFNTVIDNYPDSEYAAKAKKQLLECKKRLTSHLLGVATQYYISGDYLAAKSRLDTMKHQYPREIADLGYGHRVNQMLAQCDREIAKGPRKPSIWRRMGF
ncbi:MAG: outer membrane protein assembly factor BamD, partial [Syntrophobacteraceae bacterium]